MKKILFVHNNFPAQYVHLARALAGNPELKLAAIGSQTAQPLSGVKLLKYAMSDGDVAAAHPFARRFDLECRRAEQVLYAASNLMTSGFTPDIVLAHPGWGETLPLRAMFPRAHIIVYCEFYYRTEGTDLDFDPEFPQTAIDGKVRVHLKNAASLLALSECDRAISPTQWQRSTFPQEFQGKIEVLHDGVDVDAAKPNPRATFSLPSGRLLTRDDEVVTFVSRCFEPLRGFHILMRALPRIMAERPKAEILLIGGDGAPYGLPPPTDTSWQSVFLNEVEAAVDLSRIHFVGRVPHSDHLRALQISSAHVYLTYPFVLSWSLLEAMSTGCLVIASDTTPVREVVDGRNGLLVPFLDPDRLAETVIEALARPNRFKKHRTRARETILASYDAKRVCLPRMLAFLGLADEAQKITTADLAVSEQA